ncbi:MAG: c-type cytochrome, partial [Ardenticatenaceae bacterium]
YQEWLAGEDEVPTGTGDPGETLSAADAGAALFEELGCAGCHRMDGSGPGPSLQGVFGTEVPLENGETVVADETYIRESILDPQAKIVEGYQPIMPTFEGQVSEEQLVQLIETIKSFGSESDE